MLDTIGQDLDEARANIEATRTALQAALDGREGSGATQGDLAPLLARLERMEAELERIEAGIAVREGLG